MMQDAKHLSLMTCHSHDGMILPFALVVFHWLISELPIVDPVCSAAATAASVASRFCHIGA
jgi:hypothetical protein